MAKLLFDFIVSVGVLNSFFSEEHLNEILNSGERRSIRKQSSAPSERDKLDQVCIQ